jgi:hypothetical protein
LTVATIAVLKTCEYLSSDLFGNCGKAHWVHVISILTKRLGQDIVSKFFT